MVLEQPTDFFVILTI